MQIKALSAATGVDVETIRYYERQGLLPAPARQANGYRHYGPAQLEQLAFVRHCRGEPGAQDRCPILQELVAAAHGEACVCHGPKQGGTRG